MINKDNYVGFYQFNELIKKQLLNEIESECLDLSISFLYAYHIIFRRNSQKFYMNLIQIHNRMKNMQKIIRMKTVHFSCEYHANVFA